jgi:hypothetical protein
MYFSKRYISINIGQFDSFIFFTRLWTQIPPSSDICGKNLLIFSMDVWG